MAPIQHSKFNIPESPDSRLGRNSSQKGALLLELLIVTSILAVILSIGSQAVYVSMQSGKTSGESDTAMGLASEALEQARAVADEKWQNIYDLTKGSQYHFAQSGNKWATSTGSELITLNTGSFTRYVIIENVSRDASTRLIDAGTNYDPSTQKVTATVSWSGNGSPVTVSDYFLRWRNKVCPQASWTGGVSSGVKSCPDTTYTSKEGVVDTTGGTLKII